MREPLVAWAGDCMLRGDVELGEGRLSDHVNDLEVVTFYDATLRALDDGHEVAVDEVEVERREIHLVEVNGRRGDPARRRRTVEERVKVEVGPYIVTGNLHRPPNTQPLAALSRWTRFVPMTDASLGLRDGSDPVSHLEVLLVNRDRIGKTEIIAVVPVYTTGEWSPLPPAEPAGGAPAVPAADDPHDGLA